MESYIPHDGVKRVASGTCVGGQWVGGHTQDTELSVPASTSSPRGALIGLDRESLLPGLHPPGILLRPAFSWGSNGCWKSPDQAAHNSVHVRYPQSRDYGDDRCIQTLSHTKNKYCSSSAKGVIATGIHEAVVLFSSRKPTSLLA